MKARLLATFLLIVPTAFADTGTQLFKEVMQSGRVCAYGKTPTERQACFVSASPKKCRKEAEELMLGGDYRINVLHACVLSCGNAGFFSRALGECSRELVISDAESRVSRLNELGCYSGMNASEPHCVKAASGL